MSVPPTPPVPPVPLGQVNLTLQSGPLTSDVVTPRVWVNGHFVPTGYGANLIPVPAGPVRIDVNLQWMQVYGQAHLDLHVQPGQTVAVFYMAPAHQFELGRIGFSPVRQKGATWVWVLLAISLSTPMAVALIHLIMS